MAATLARYSWLPGALAAALVIGVGRLVSAPLELSVYDRVLRAVDAVPMPEVVVVTIDPQSVAKLGEWPWPRDVHANFLDQLSSAGARVVAFTLPLATSQRTSESEHLRAALALLESSNLEQSAQAQELRRLLGASARSGDPDAHLADAITTHGNVVLPVEIRPGAQGEEPAELPARLLPVPDRAALRAAHPATIIHAPARPFTAVASAVGHTYLPADADDIVRSDAAAMRVGQALLPSLAAATAARALDVAPDEMVFLAGDSLRLGERSRPLDATFAARPHYFPPSGARAFPQYSYWDVLSGTVAREALHDKVVLVGPLDTVAAAASTATPVSSRSPAVVTTASAVSSLLSADGLYSRPGLAVALEWLVALGVIAFAAFALPAAGALVGALATALILAILVVSEIGLLSSAQIWVRFMLPCIAIMAGYGLYVLGELFGRANAREVSPADSADSLRRLGQTFQAQGQLDLAFETYRRCPLDAPTLELLYSLGLDYERRRQLQKASNVYSHIATRDPNYRDLRARRARVQEGPMTRGPLTRGPMTRGPLTRGPATRAAATPIPATPPELETDSFASTMPGTSAHALGRYQIERELGKGAMGTVYLGRDPKINRVVAIKAIPLAEEFEEEDLAEARARFFREAEMAGRLNHPAIVTVYDAGEDQGLAYIAMEYLRGQHLSHFTDSSRLMPFKATLLLMARVADALDYAHRQNVVHRDIKPANIMFNPDTDELKITDFGIARLTDTSRTKTGIVLGTPSFMSPEQLEGRPLDGRSDQFALGVSLYQLLCGQLPFRAESMPRLMHKIATEPHASIRLIRPELPASIDALFERVLAKPADHRYPTCAELAQALRACAGPQEANQPAEAKHEWLIP